MTIREAVVQARRKVYVEGPAPDVRVPFAEVELSGGQPAGAPVRHLRPGSAIRSVGLPPLRGPWIAERGDVLRSGAGTPLAGVAPAVTQLAYARPGS